jgi:hypothetical protein
MQLSPVPVVADLASRAKCALFIALALALAGCARPVLRTDIWIPDEFRGHDSSGMSIYGKGKAGTPSAIGQVFESPPSHGELRRVGFLAMQPTLNSVPSKVFGVTTTSIRVRMLVSAWDGEKPTWPPAWDSQAVAIQKTLGRGDGMSHIEWLWFDLPPIKLQQGRKYLAWLTMAGLDNHAMDTIAVVRMGPRGSIERPKLHSVYPPGAMAIWSGTNPDDTLAPMSGSAWTIESTDVNLRFRMLFQ